MTATNEYQPGEIGIRPRAACNYFDDRSSERRPPSATGISLEFRASARNARLSAALKCQATDKPKALILRADPFARAMLPIQLIQLRYNPVPSRSSAAPTSSSSSSLSLSLPISLPSFRSLPVARLERALVRPRFSPPQNLLSETDSRSTIENSIVISVKRRRADRARARYDAFSRGRVGSREPTVYGVFAIALRNGRMLNELTTNSRMRFCGTNRVESRGLERDYAADETALFEPGERIAFVFIGVDARRCYAKKREKHRSMLRTRLITRSPFSRSFVSRGAVSLASARDRYGLSIVAKITPRESAEGEKESERVEGVGGERGEKAERTSGSSEG